MKTEDIIVGKKYWAHYGYDPTVVTIQAKCEASNTFIVTVGEMWFMPITDILELREIHAPYKPLFSVFKPWTWFSK